MLTDDANADDLLTIRTIVRLSMDPLLGIAANEDTVLTIAGSALNLLRWRNQSGLSHWSELNKLWFDKYVEELRTGGVAGTLRFEQRCLELAERIDRNDVDVPLTKNGRYAAMNTLAEHVGVSQRNQIPNRFWQPVLEAARRQKPHIENEDVRTEEYCRRDSDHFETVRTALQTWLLLHQYRDWLTHDQLSFDPFPYPTSVERLANSITAREKKTRSLPPAYETCLLINEALSCCVQDADAVVAFHLGLSGIRRDITGKSDEAYSKRRDAIIRLVGEVGSGTAVGRFMGAQPELVALTTGQLIYRSRRFFRSLLSGAAAIGLSAFLARRPTETLSYRRSDVDQGETGRPRVRSWISKTRFQEEFLPAPACVASIFQLLRMLSTEVTGVDQDGWLFDIDDPIHGGRFSVGALAPSVQEFASYAGVTELSDGTTMLWSAYHLRHFFATLYYYRFHFPSLRALNWFLRQADLDTTRFYIHAHVHGERLRLQDEEAAEKLRNEATALHRDFEAVRVDFIKQTAADAITGKHVLGGNGGRAWARELQDLVTRASLQISVSSVPEDAMHFDEVLSE